ncbi:MULTISPECIES: GuaB3 family IMP dehydrogenase-related protein [Rhodococcus]|uniref:GuaB3 family IMP dehydrogenase-related protein n=1 Tax=Rhodococcus oxybenzonivorans TaxID=1990687 RepID=A0AAE4UVY6_9NOCA|nr:MULTISPECIES: GuaB3 family IMP dehydrogenase-related protein [Rhodococcus]MDV7245467.1 GuaB3 family IMP dehydrogenase-related protein [Rhodococcus oxybenzonivorans]MDV7263268.1 GuaB3 family IMP dehydrogenase-related protein [Rhodococcus oxybenzonivorans]MDV7276547.1 GuaB3 family IMP dehydrogenase-related protein [Rhodococcus oxybenzonivorans]MDV7336526.1 GuaB3 family IMP dehydrogenase-related protein [Rhodococcus oxybenzonivorans]MDV7346857.1 GuaB3 family IMP dehydrogenase-related protein [
MRDLVEIGMGRTARRTYELDDIDIVPSRRTRSSKEVSTSWQLDAYRFDIPVLAHPTDALVSPAFAIELGKRGGLGVINGEGLWGRHADVEAKLAELVALAESDVDVEAPIRKLQELHAAPLQPNLLAAAVAQVRDSGVTTAVRVSPQNARALTPHLIEAGIDLLVVHGTIISAEHVAHGDSEPLNLKTFISELDVPVVAGGVSDHRTALHLMRTGAAGVIVGYGSTEGATTTGEVLGIGLPMATAIADAAAARRDYLDETGGRYVHVIADGDIASSGDLAKAIACGADAAVLGAPLAVAAEAPGGGWYWPSAAAHPSVPRGTMLPVSFGERPSLDQVLAGPSNDPYGSLNFVGGLRRSMAKSGYSDLKEFQKVGLTVRA